MIFFSILLTAQTQLWCIGWWVRWWGMKQSLSISFLVFVNLVGMVMVVIDIMYVADIVMIRIRVILSNNISIYFNWFQISLLGEKRLSKLKYHRYKIFVIKSIIIYPISLTVEVLILCCEYVGLNSKIRTYRYRILIQEL